MGSPICVGPYDRISVDERYIYTPRDASDYAIGDVRIQVHHLGETGLLKVKNMRGDDWYRNPVTGEDRFAEVDAKESVHRAHGEIWKGYPRVHNNLWVTTKPRSEARFLAAIVPYRDKEPAPRVQKLAPGMVEVAVDGEQGDVIVF